MGRRTYYVGAKKLEPLTEEERADLIFDLINAFSLVKDPLSSAGLLEDLLTKNEVVNLSKRLRIAKLISSGMTHEEIVSELHCSYTTITKVKVWMDEAGGGLRRVIERLPKRKEGFEYRRGYFGYGLPQLLVGGFVDYMSEVEKGRLEKFVRKVEKKDGVLRRIQKQADEDFRYKKLSKG